MNGNPPPALQQPNTPKPKSRSGPRSRSSPYKGVTQYKRTGKWEAHIWIPGGSRGKGHQRHLGSYNTAEEAARCFDRGTIHVRGTKEELNFPLQDYAQDPFMLEHAKTDKFKFLDLMRAKFAIKSAIPASGPKSYRARSPRPSPTPRKIRARKNNNITYSDDEEDEKEEEYSDDPEYYAAKGAAKRPASGYLQQPSRPRNTMTSKSTTATTAIMFKQQRQSPGTPYQVGLTGTISLAPRTTTSVVQSTYVPPGGKRTVRVSDLAPMPIRRLSNYANQRIQAKRQQYHRGVAEEEDYDEEGEDEQEEEIGVQYTAAGIEAPARLFSPPPSSNQQGWGRTTISLATTPTVGINRPQVSFASTFTGLPIGPAAPAVVPSRFLGSAFTTGPTSAFTATGSTCGPVLPSSSAAPVPKTVYNAVNFQTEAHAAHENFLLPSILESAGGAENGGTGGSSGDGPLNTDDLIAGIQLFSGQHDAPPSQEYKDWLCNSPYELAAQSPSTAV